jgi:hypothetical protein
VRVVDANDWTLRVFRAERKEQLLGSLRWMYATPEAMSGLPPLASLAQGERNTLVEMELRALDGSRLHAEQRCAGNAAQRSGSGAGKPSTSPTGFAPKRHCINRELLTA